jgi:hypothetical protein
MVPGFSPCPDGLCVHVISLVRMNLRDAGFFPGHPEP